MRRSSGSRLGEVGNKRQCGLAFKKKLKPKIYDNISFAINRIVPARNTNEDIMLTIVLTICTKNP